MIRERRRDRVKRLLEVAFDVARNGFYALENLTPDLNGEREERLIQACVLALSFTVDALTSDDRQPCRARKANGTACRLSARRGELFCRQHRETELFEAWELVKGGAA